MRAALFCLLILPLAISCGDKDDTAQDPPEADTDTDTDADSDTDADADADTDADADADTDADADADTDADTDTGLPACTVADLVFSAEVRDPSGAACTTCPAEVILDFVGVVDNPCANDVVLTTGSSCLVAGWTLTEVYSGTTLLNGKPGCYEVETDWVVSASGSVEESFDSYTTWQEVEHLLDVTFGDLPSSTASARFDIDEF